MERNPPNRVELYSSALSALRVTVIAGSGIPGYADGNAQQARFYEPRGVVVDKEGGIYVADTRNGCIRYIRDGKVSTYVNKDATLGAVDGEVTTAKLGGPYGLAVLPSGALIVCDTLNHIVRIIENDQIKTIAGTPEWFGYTDGNALFSRFASPRSLAYDEVNDRILIADNLNHVVRSIKDGKVSTIAGRGGKPGFADGKAENALFHNPNCVAIDPRRGNALLVSDYYNSRIRMIRDGIVSTLAGSGRRGGKDGALHEAQFDGPTGIIVHHDLIFVTDFDGCRIRLITENYVQTIVGRESTVPRFYPLKCPTEVYLDLSRGRIVFSDTMNHQVCQLECEQLLHEASLVIFPKQRTPDLTPSLNLLEQNSTAHSFPTTLVLQLGDYPVTLYTPLLNERCPNWSNQKVKRLPANSLSREALDAFLKYFYSEYFPKSSLPVYFGVAYLAKLLKMEFCLGAALRELHQAMSLCEENIPIVSELLSRLDDEFPECEAVMSLVSPTTVREMGNKMIMKVLKLMKMASRRKRSSRLLISLSNLFASGLHTDWTITVMISALENNPDSVHRCHSFVLYARWTYFKHMMEAGLSETRQRQLKLPYSASVDGGLTPLAVHAILETIYCGSPSSSTLKRFTMHDAIVIYAHKELYQLEENVFEPLLSAVEKMLEIHEDNCEEALRLAEKHNIDWLREAALILRSKE